MFLLLIVHAYSQTTWKDTLKGENYEWSSLSKSADKYYKIVDNTNPFTPSTYNFNFDKELPESCSGQTVIASETIEFSDGWMASCSILGHKNMQTVELIAGGIKITYNGGDVCFEDNTITNRKIYFELICSPKEGDWTVKESAYNNYCKVGLTKNSKAGCPVISSTSSALFWVLVVALVIAGIIWLSWSHIKKLEEEYKMREKLSGIFARVVEIGENGVEKAKGMVGMGKAKNYEMV